MSAHLENSVSPQSQKGATAPSWTVVEIGKAGSQARRTFSGSERSGSTSQVRGLALLEEGGQR